MRLRAVAGGIAGIALAAPLLLACGGSNLPEAPPCVEPTPTTSNRGPDADYFRAVQEGVRKLEALTSDFRLEWPGNRFSSKREFREGFVHYAAESRCTADAMLRLQPGDSESTQAMHEKLTPLLQSHIALLDEGLQAVQRRNVSDYRRFHERVDESQKALEQALSSRRHGP